MANERYASFVPNGVGIGGIISLLLGFIPLASFAGPFIGGLAATYIEEYGLVKSSISGFIVGLISLIPLAIYALVGILFTGGSAILEMDALAGLGILGGLFGSIYALMTILLNPFIGLLGGLSLGIYFHLIHKATD